MNSENSSCAAVDLLQKEIKPMINAISDKIISQLSYVNASQGIQLCFATILIYHLLQVPHNQGIDANKEGDMEEDY